MSTARLDDAEPTAPPDDGSGDRGDASAVEAGDGAPSIGGTGALFLATFLIATCGLVYELVAGAMASYLLGDSITQFSLVIGIYLSAMGLGSWLSKFVTGDLLARFIQVEVAVGVLGGISALALLGSYALLGSVRPVLFLLVGAIGTLVGIEIPVLMRVLKDQLAFSELVARVLAFDYLGALAASVAFPLLLVPLLGLTRTAFAFGLVNTVVGLILTWVFAARLGKRARRLRVGAGLATAALVAGLVGAEKANEAAEQHIYDAQILLREKSPYQQVVLTHYRGDLRLWLDGHLQFSSKDEHRYHEALVHPGAASVPGGPRRALVLGGGDGMALREVLRYPTLEAATLVDLDPLMTELFSTRELLTELNDDAFADPRVTAVNADGMKWLEESDAVFDLVVVDLPDPRNYAIGKLYTRAFYRLLQRHVSRTGAVVVQSTSPFLAPTAFWCIEATLADAGFTTHPYHAWVPSFGDWGFVLALPQPRPRPEALAPSLDPAALAYLNDATLDGLFAFPADQRRPEGIEVNRLGDQILVKYHEQDWRKAD